MAVWFELCKLMRWLLRRPAPLPQGIGQRYQAAEQAEAQRRLLDQAEGLRRTQRYSGNGTRDHG
ncbi:hypothetical protein [Micromonospora thermarum]|uniref:Uncharacterized protein n=1 Tax=Micromonospora thermarum TaxID=2720024 RepID=A0ABX0ZBH6_9ACTN|nr:hypothetical protein [Micromonospora thermarum]NJP35277.1 hypothetical protein [Micromonospora thermarum]